MNYQKHLNWAAFITVLINAAAMFSPVINSGDAITYAALAQHIALSNDWASLVLDGHDWLDKPHLPFWITALFFKLGGISAFTYSLPGFIFHLIGAYYTYRLARLLYSKHTAVLAVLIYVSIFNLMDASIEVKAETYLIGQIMPACYYWLRYDAQSRIKYLVLGALFTAMAIMTKGIFTLFTITSGLVCLWLYQKQWSKLFSIKWLAALVLSLLFVAPELIALHLQFNQHAGSSELEQPISSFKFFFWDSQFGRFFNTGPIQNRNGHPLYFVLVFLWAFLPWTMVFFAAVYAQLRAFGKADANERGAFVFLCGAFSFTFLMFSATQFQFDYYIDIHLAVCSDTLRAILDCFRHQSHPVYFTDGLDIPARLAGDCAEHLCDELHTVGGNGRVFDRLDVLLLHDKSGVIQLQDHLLLCCGNQPALCIFVVNDCVNFYALQCGS